MLNSSRITINVEEEMVYSLHLYDDERIHFEILAAIMVLYTHLISVDGRYYFQYCSKGWKFFVQNAF